MQRKLFLATLLCSLSGFAQTQVFRESFGFGVNYQRPKSGKGRLESIFPGKSLSGFWAEFPSDKNTTWMTPDVSGTPGWNFAASTPNPYEAPTPLAAPGENGTAWCFNDLGAFRSVALLAPFAVPRTSYRISAELMPRPILGHYTALGITGSNSLEDNFETGAAVWVRIRQETAGDFTYGIAEFHTRGLAGPAASVRVPVSYNGFNRVEITMDLTALRATATVSGIVVGTLPIPAGTPRYIGFEGSGGADNLVVTQ